MSLDLAKYKIIGRSPAMRTLAEWVQAAAPQWDTLLITGERGTGKELLAQAIHRLGPTRGKELVIVDCASLHSATIESTLFGHERGSFTGAVHRHIGLLESAQEGTLFLDEIGTLPLDLQARFLRFLEEGTIQRIGAAKPIQIRARILAATNRDLAMETAQGRFLPDLYDRLSVLKVTCPPLRERGDDVFLLFEHFLGKHESKRLEPATQAFLREYTFPGNVRELRNLSRRLAVFYPEGKIRREDIVGMLDSQKNEFI